MGTQILSPKKVFVDRTNKIKNRPKPTNERKPKKTKNDVKKPNLVNGQVTLLRRGESLSSVKVQQPAFNLVDVNLIEPVLLPNRVYLPPLPDVMFVGSSITSPSPRKVPLPSFFSRARVEDEVSKDLRRMLRLE